MSTFKPEENARRLKAWNAWKEVCWVHGLGRPREGLSVVGTAEDEALLSTVIANAFKKKLSPFMLQLGDEDGRTQLSDIDFAQEFDDALLEYEKAKRYKRGHFGEEACIRKPKAWKDFVWDAVARSDDPPLKVINGKLIGSQGVINQVVEDWLFANYSCHVDGDMVVFSRSRDAQSCTTGTLDGVSSGEDDFSPSDEGIIEVASSGGETGNVDFDAADSVSSVLPHGEDIAVPAAWRDELEREFSPRLCCLLLAHIYDIKVYKDTDILAALQISKTTAAEELKDKPGRAYASLNSELREWLREDDAGKKFFLNWMKNRCAAEKAGQIILSRMMDSTNAFV
mgnify:FL=1